MKPNYDYSDEEFNSLFNETNTIYEEIIDFLIDHNFKLEQGSELKWFKGKTSVYLDEPLLLVQRIKGEYFSKEFYSPYDLLNWLILQYK